MSARATRGTEAPDDQEMLDEDTSAAILRWMETAAVPDGIDPMHWQSWMDGGCCGPIEANGVTVTSGWLGLWAGSASSNR